MNNKERYIKHLKENIYPLKGFIRAIDEHIESITGDIKDDRLLDLLNTLQVSTRKVELFLDAHHADLSSTEVPEIHIETGEPEHPSEPSEGGSVPRQVRGTGEGPMTWNQRGKKNGSPMTQDMKHYVRTKEYKEKREELIRHKKYRPGPKDANIN